MHLGISEKSVKSRPETAYRYNNNAGLISKEKTLKIAVVDNPTVI